MKFLFPSVSGSNVARLILMLLSMIWILPVPIRAAKDIPLHNVWSKFKIVDVFEDVAGKVSQTFGVKTASLYNDGPVPLAKRRFIIHGWRWHTMSLLRDLDRLSRVIDASIRGTPVDFLKDYKTSLELICRIKDGYDFACNFNMRTLHEVENKLFLPMLRYNVENARNNTASRLFRMQSIVNEIQHEHRIAMKLSNSVAEQCKQMMECLEQMKPAGIRTLAADTCIVDFRPNDIRSSYHHLPLPVMKRMQLLDRLETIRSLVKAITTSVLRIQDIQTRELIPCMTAYCSVREQDVVNNRIPHHIGLYNAQIHLVSMLEAIESNPTEKQLYLSQIPRFVRALIPIWRERLYLPKTRCLQLP